MEKLSIVSGEFSQYYGGVAVDDPIPTEHIEAVRMGTTVATNALLERKGESTLLVVTHGFADQLQIGYQNRPRLFDLNIRFPEALYDAVVEADERMGSQGEVVKPLDKEKLEADLARAHREGFRAVAICLMHGYRYNEHEVAVEKIARHVGFEQVSVSYKVSPLMKFVSRGNTTVVDAYLSPILRRHVERMVAALGETRLLFMQSNGGLVDAHHFQGKDAIFSGPAGGIVGAVEVARSAGFDRIIGFDMGGTSTDVSHYAGRYERAIETEVAGLRMRAPMLDIHTVAAGGGSILHYDGRRFRVGPETESAGANPGAACYRRGGPLTVTDCNLMLGRLLPGFFPHIFGPEGNKPLDVDIVRRKFISLAGRIGDGRSAEAVAEGFLRIAVENMAHAIKRISIERGYDVTSYVLHCFGGAGGQHACAVADVLGMETVLIHPFAGVLSAYGMGLADIRVLRETAVEVPLAEIGEVEVAFEQLEALAWSEMGAQGVPPDRVEVERRLHVRYDGTNAPLTVPFGPEAEVRVAFENQHRQRFGFVSKTKGLVVEAVTLELIGRADWPVESVIAGGGEKSVLTTEVRLFTEGQMHEVPIRIRGNLRPGSPVMGPAIVVEDTATTVVESGWEARLLESGNLVLKRVRPVIAQVASRTEADPVLLEVFNNLFMATAEQMGASLVATASSVNIKERLDFSCAVFDSNGELVANAPHIPVHLGSMSESVQSVIRSRTETMAPGDVFMLNAPYNGGTHLPDVTFITPVFAPDGNAVWFYVANRGHHADIGGITPGSMPPDSRHIEEEGVFCSMMSRWCAVGAF